MPKWRRIKKDKLPQQHLGLYSRGEPVKGGSKGTAGTKIFMKFHETKHTLLHLLETTLKTSLFCQ